MNAPSSLSRRSLLASLVAVPAIGALLAACGDNSSTSSAGAIEHGTGADDVIVRIGSEGGFVPRGFAFTNIPTVLISGDRRLIEPGAQIDIYPGPLLSPLFERSITEAGLQKVLQLADAAKLLQTPPDYSATINVADVPDTVVDLNVRGQKYHHQAFALGMEDPADSATPQRAALAKFVQLMGNVEAVVGAKNLGEPVPVKTDSYRIQATPLTEADIAGYQPAPTIVNWPSAAGVSLAAAGECALVPAAKIGSLFTDANQLTFFSENDVVYQVAAAQLLPGDAC